MTTSFQTTSFHPLVTSFHHCYRTQSFARSHFHCFISFPRPRTGPTAQIFSAVAPYTFVAGFVAASSLIPGGSGSLSVSLPCKEAGLGGTWAVVLFEKLGDLGHCANLPRRCSFGWPVCSTSSLLEPRCCRWSKCWIRIRQSRLVFPTPRCVVLRTLHVFLVLVRTAGPSFFWQSCTSPGRGGKRFGDRGPAPSK